jgi:secreted PhoX family phosphatase
VTDQGKAYALARNDLNDSEFTGPAFGADGRILFACIQSPRHGLRDQRSVAAVEQCRVRTSTS